jgi:hypothetical protein
MNRVNKTNPFGFSPGAKAISFLEVLKFSHVLFLLIDLTSIFHSGRYSESGQDVSLQDNPDYDNRNNPPVIHFSFLFLVTSPRKQATDLFCIFRSISFRLIAFHSTRPRYIRLKRSRPGGSKTENSSRWRNWKSHTKKKIEAYRYLKLHKMGIRILLAGQRETQAVQKSFRICCTEIHRWALNNLLEGPI